VLSVTDVIPLNLAIGSTIFEPMNASPHKPHFAMPRSKYRLRVLRIPNMKFCLSVCYVRAQVARSTIAGTSRSTVSRWFLLRFPYSWRTVYVVETKIEPSSKFARKMEEAISALLTQRNIEEGARTAGIGTQTLIRWMKVPAFQTAYREARRAAFSQSIARLQQGTLAAASTLLKIMLDQNSPASSRVRAAECIMNDAAKSMEIEDIEIRVAALEEAAKEQKK
jgi:hypothetical protein